MVINGSTTPVSLVPDQQLEGQWARSRRAANRREGRVLFAVLLFALEFMLVARLLPLWVVDAGFNAWQRLGIFALVYGLIAWVTYLLVGDWARDNRALMKIHRGEEMAMRAELDRRNAIAAPPVRALRSWSDVGSRARTFFLG